MILHRLAAFSSLAVTSIVIGCSSEQPAQLSSGGAGGSGGDFAGSGGTGGNASTGSTGGSGGAGGTSMGGAGGMGGSGGEGGNAMGGAGGAGGGTCIGQPDCKCPVGGPIAGYSEHDGLRKIDSSHFDLVDTKTFEQNRAIIDGLGLPVVALDALNLNRTGTKPDAALAADLSTVVGYQGAFEWESGDQNVSYWIPQGLTGVVAGAREYVIVSWHYDELNIANDPNPPATGDKGVRLSFADVKSLGGDVPYRHLLLVAPDATKGFVSVNIHAGGLAFYGPWLFVADTSRGIRVFDTTRILSVSTSAACSAQIGKVGAEICGYGYAYVLPQVGSFFYPAGTDASCKAKFSYLSFDATSSPPSLLSGEYDNDTTVGIYSRILRYPLDTTTKLPALDPQSVAHATEAYYAGNRNLQGVASVNGKFFLNATRYSGALSTGAVNQPSKVYQASNGKWGWMPEGIHYVPASDRLYINTEGHTNMPRIVYAVKASQIP